jgi:hypothetical protein
MTEQTARDLLIYFVTTFVNNGFSDIGTFLLPDYSVETQYEQDLDSYQFTDSTTAIQDLLRDGNTRPNEALRRLLTAAQQYFNRAAAIPEAYANAIATFDSADRLRLNTKIQLLGRDQESIINVSGILESTQLRQMQRLLGLLSERIGEEDDSFLNDLNNF